MKLTLEHIDRTINNLDRLMPAKLNKNSTREYSLKESIFLIAPKLLEKKDMGCTTNELVKALTDDGIIIKAATLNHYLCEYQKQSPDKTEAQPDQAEASDKSNSGGEKSGPVKPTANQDKSSVNQGRNEVSKEEKPAVPSQSAEKPKYESWQSVEKYKSESGQYSETLEPGFGQSEKIGNYD